MHELKQLVRNPVALAVVIGAIILPVACMWCLVAAQWNPPSYADNLKVAIVNEDAGVAIDSIDADKEDRSALARRLGGVDMFNIGELVLDEMREDHSLDWQFVDAAQAESGLASGEYYAELVLPEGFTKDFLAVLAGDLDQPRVERRVSQAHDVTPSSAAGVGSSLADSVVDEKLAACMSAAFASIVKGPAFDIAAAGVMSGATSRTGLVGASNDLKTVKDGLVSVSFSIENWRTKVESAKSSLDKLSQSVPELRDALSDSREVLANARTAEHEAASAYSSAFAQGGKELSFALKDVAERVSNAVAAISSKSSDIERALASAEKALSESERLVAELRKIDPSSETVANLERQIESLKSDIDALKKASKDVDGAASTADEVATSLSEDVDKTIGDMEGRSNAFNGELLPRLDTALDSIALAMGSLDGSLSSLEAQVGQAKALLDQLDAVLQKTSGALVASEESLGSASEGITSARSDLSAVVNSKALKQASGVGAAASTAGSVGLSPVSVEVVQAYPLAAYGAGLAPFYMSLALWAGCLMLVLLVSPEVDPGRFPGMRPWQGYLGCLLLYVALALLQGALMAASGLLFGLQASEVALLLGAGLLAAFCFISVVYALDVTFEHAGKVLAVLLLVVQVPTVLWTIPVELMPGFLQDLRAWLPLTYGVSAMHEAVGGLDGAAYAQCLAWLAACGAATLALAFFVRPRALALNHLVGMKLAAADVFVVNLADLESVDVEPVGVSEKRSIASRLKDKLDSVKPVRDDVVAAISSKLVVRGTDSPEVSDEAREAPEPENFTEVVWERETMSDIEPISDEPDEPAAPDESGPVAEEGADE